MKISGYFVSNSATLKDQVTCPSHQKKRDMAKKLDPMDLKQIIRLHLDGFSNRKISKTLGIGRNAVNHYMQLFTSCDMTFEGHLSLNDSDLKGQYPQNCVNFGYSGHIVPVIPVILCHWKQV